MNSNVATFPAGAVPSAYPLRRGGGAFLICIGLGLVCAIAFSGAALINYSIFFAGAGAGVAALFGSRHFARSRPPRLHIMVLSGALLLEFALFVMMGRTLPHGTPENVRWLWASIIVGVHFLPMTVAFGPRFLVLGLLCIANGVLGLLAPAVPYEYFGLFDGALKISCGVWMLTAKH
jgi:Family of unknown function (DUF6609)